MSRALFSAFLDRCEIVPGTLKVYPLNNYGAVETGVHRFFQLLPGKPGKPEKLVEVSQLTSGRRTPTAGNWRV